MGQDRPDYYARVEPTSFVPHIGFSTYNAIGTGKVGASSSVAAVHNLADDGYTYILDEVYTLIYSTADSIVIVDICDDQSSPVWRSIAYLKGKSNLRVRPYASSALTLKYPQASRVAIYNGDASIRDFDTLTTYYRYVA